jgi:very-short-patch-repair endonuclease
MANVKHKFNFDNLGGYCVIPSVVMKSNKIGSPAKKVLCYLMTLWTSTTEIHPSVPTIANATDQGERSVKYAIRELIDHGLIKIAQRGNGPGHSNSYVVNASAINRFFDCEILIDEAKKQENKKKIEIKHISNGKDLLVKYAKEHRNNPTKAESKVWKFLKRSGVNHTFQDPIRIPNENANYIIDFTLKSKTLGKTIAIEVDGGYHNDKSQQEKDNKRDHLLEKCGWAVVRLTNDEVENNLYEHFFRKMKGLGAFDILNKISIAHNKNCA